jgi:hypothetical protein
MGGQVAAGGNAALSLLIFSSLAANAEEKHIAIVRI